MRYTRYDYNKKKNNNFFSSLVFVVIFGVVIGIGLFKLLNGGVSTLLDWDNNNKSKSDTAEVNSESISQQQNSNYVAIQCGVFNNIDNANVTLASIPSSYDSFIVQDADKYKVIAGIYSDEVANEKSTELNNSSISNYCIKFALKEDNKQDVVVREIVNGYFEILNKVSDDSVKSINTNEFKAWVSKVAENNDDEVVRNIVQKTNELPEEFTKENKRDTLVYLFSVLNDYRE